MQSFQSLQLSASTLNAIAAMGFETPTPIQDQAIPPMLEGRDLIAQARTGTGKTAAFGIPLVEAALADPYDGVVALVLVPTRELALQVTDELNAIAKGSQLRVIPVYGGVGMGQQVDALRGRAFRSFHAPRGARAHQPSSAGMLCVVATPGRLLDHVRQRTIRLNTVRTLILDEADRMLDMGFLPDVERIMSELPEQRQTALFSATVPEPIRKLCNKFLHQPVTVKVEAGPTATPLAEQFVIGLEKPEKAQGLAALLKKENPERAIVFTRTKHLARRLAEQLSRGGWGSVALQGNMTQGQRERALQAFRDGKARILVATDIASRGLDVPDVTHVINFDVPMEPEAYVHRVGRTARMGKSGRAFTFVERGQGRDLHDIERVAGLRLGDYDLGPLPPAPPRPAQPQGPGPRAHHAQPARAPSYRSSGPRHAQRPQGERSYGERRDGERSYGGPRRNGPQQRRPWVR